MKFVDSSPLKGAALELELKLKKYQKQIGTSSTRKADVRRDVNVLYNTYYYTHSIMIWVATLAGIIR